MRRFARLAATLLLLVLSFPLGASSPQDPLWGKAVELARAGKDWVPQTASFLLELVDDGGVPRESWQSWYRISVAPSGDMTLEVTRAVHNGADTTEKERESQKKRKATPFSMGDNPFDPLLQETVDAAPRGETATVAGRRCARYDFSMKKKDGAVLTGTSWLDERTGAPVEVSYTGSRLPRGVLELATTLRYAPGPGGEAFLKEARVEGVAGILFLRRSFRTSITIEGYARRG